MVPSYAGAGPHAQLTLYASPRTIMTARKCTHNHIQPELQIALYPLFVQVFLDIMQRGFATEGRRDGHSEVFALLLV